MANSYVCYGMRALSLFWWQGATSHNSRPGLLGISLCWALESCTALSGVVVDVGHRHQREVWGAALCFMSCLLHALDVLAAWLKEMSHWGCGLSCMAVCCGCPRPSVVCCHSSLVIVIGPTACLPARLHACLHDIVVQQDDGLGVQSPRCLQYGSRHRRCLQDCVHDWRTRLLDLSIWHTGLHDTDVAGSPSRTIGPVHGFRLCGCWPWQYVWWGLTTGCGTVHRNRWGGGGTGVLLSDVKAM